MKRSKLILAAVTVLTIAGGTLAFKAHRTQTIFTGPELAKPCLIAKPNATISVQGTRTFATLVQGQNCKDVLTVFHAN